METVKIFYTKSIIYENGENIFMDFNGLMGFRNKDILIHRKIPSRIKYAGYCNLPTLTLFNKLYVAFKFRNPDLVNLN